MSKEFDLAYEHVKKWEGGYVNNKNDKGGATNFGISIKFLEDFHQTRTGQVLLGKMNIHKVNVETIKNLTLEQAKAIYKKAFWEDTNISKLPLKFAIVVFDFAVNSGSYAGARILQRAINADVDGIIGPLTITQAKIKAEENEQAVLETMFKYREDFYNNIVKRNASQKVFLKGWLNRLNSLVEYVKGV